MMQAALIREHGGPDVIEVGETPRPSPGPGEILVRIGACALNHLDIFVRRGMPGVHLPFPHVSGGDIAGWVEASGDEAGRALEGRAILIDPSVHGHALGEGPWGGLADYIVVPTENAIVLGESGTNLDRYAALPIGYGTAYRMLTARAQLRAGETVVILGASGGVGVACVQFAHRIGARIIVCSSSDEKLARLRELGADETINTDREDFSRRAWQLTDKQGADVVVDYNGRDTWAGSIRCTRPLGRVVTCGATTGFEAVTDLRYVWTRELSILGSNGWTRDDLTTIVAQVRDGDLEPVIHGVFPLSRIHEAEAEIEERRAFGKVIVVPDEVLNARA